MKALELYLLKASIGISVLYLFYWLFLRNETYYSWNRIYLLVSVFISLLFPWFNLAIFNHGNTELISKILEPITVNNYYNPNTTTSSSISILSIIYISGAVFFSLRFLSSMGHLQWLYLRFPKVRFKGFKAVLVDKDLSPFTFFNILFISRNDYENGNVDEMIVHEKAHKEEFHSFDVILLELITIILWFNPIIWILSQSLKYEHEFFADNRVLDEGFDKGKYQQLLFEKSIGLAPIGITHNFNTSLLKKRLKMMTIKRSGSLVKIKYLISMPILLVMILSLAINVNSYAQKQKVYEEVDVMAKYKDGDMQGAREFIMQNITYPESAKKSNVEAKIFVQFIVDEKGHIKDAHVIEDRILFDDKKDIVVVGYAEANSSDVDTDALKDLEEEALRVINLLGDFTPAQKDGKDVASLWTFPINFVLQE